MTSPGGTNDDAYEARLVIVKYDCSEVSSVMRTSDRDVRRESCRRKWDRDSQYVWVMAKLLRLEIGEPAHVERTLLKVGGKDVGVNEGSTLILGVSVSVMYVLFACATRLQCSFSVY